MNQPNSNDIILINNVVHHYEKGVHKSYQFLLPSYYQVIDFIGKGAYGIVVSAFNQKLGMKVAVKKIVNLFEMNKTFQKRVLREVKIMLHVSREDTHHDNVLALVELIPPFNYQSFRDLYLSTTLMDYDLTRITRVSDIPTQRMVKYCIYQILSGVNHLHKMNIVHRDLKPSNILLSNNLDVKICDFGLSRGLDEGVEVSCTYVATRFYRAPELCLAWKRSGFECDIWSVGCILAEFLARPAQGRMKVLFPGFHNLDQLRLIFQVLGKPNLSDLQGCDDGRRWVRDFVPNNVQKTDLRHVFPHATPDSIDLLSKLLVVNPLRRIKAKDALEHPYLKEIHEEFLKYQKKELEEEGEEGEEDGEEEFGINDNNDDMSGLFGSSFSNDQIGGFTLFPNEEKGKGEDEKIYPAKLFMFRFDEKKYNSPDVIKMELYREIKNFYKLGLGFKGRIFIDGRTRHIRCVKK